MMPIEKSSNLVVTDMASAIFERNLLGKIFDKAFIRFIENNTPKEPIADISTFSVSEDMNTPIEIKAAPIKKNPI